MVHIMAADVLVTQAARASEAMMFTKFSVLNLVMLNLFEETRR